MIGTSLCRLRERIQPRTVMRRDHRSREIQSAFLGERRASVRGDVREVPQAALAGDALRQRPRSPVDRHASPACAVCFTARAHVTEPLRYPCVKRAMSKRRSRAWRRDLRENPRAVWTFYKAARLLLPPCRGVHEGEEGQSERESAVPYFGLSCL
jgi:hypothetical protein